MTDTVDPVFLWCRQMAVVTSYEGPPEQLGEAEQYYLALSRVPSFQLRVELMLLVSGTRTCSARFQCFDGLTVPWLMICKRKLLFEKFVLGNLA